MFGFASNGMLYARQKKYIVRNPVVIASNVGVQKYAIQSAINADKTTWNVLNVKTQ